MTKKHHKLGNREGNPAFRTPSPFKAQKALNRGFNKKQIRRKTP